MIERFLSVLLGYLKLEAERASASGTSIFMQNSLGHLNNNKCVRLRLRLQFGSSIFYFKQVVRKIDYEIDWINYLVTYRDAIIVITCRGKLEGFILLNIFSVIITIDILFFFLIQNFYILYRVPLTIQLI